MLISARDPSAGRGMLTASAVTSALAPRGIRLLAGRRLTRAPRASLPHQPGITLDATAEGSAVNCGNAVSGPCQHYLMEAPPDGDRGVSDECPAGCCPHDSAPPGAGCPGDLPAAPLPERAFHLRNCRLLAVGKIAAVTGADREFITPAAVRGRARAEAARRRPAPGPPGRARTSGSTR